MQKVKYLRLIFILTLFSVKWEASKAETNQAKAKKFVDKYNVEAQKHYENVYGATWEFQSDMKPELQAIIAEAEANYTKFDNIVTKKAQKLPKKGIDAATSRQLMFISKSDSPKDSNLANQQSQLVTNMTQLWGKGGVCIKNEDGKCKVFWPLIPNLLQTMAQSLNYNQRLFAWKGFRDSTGPFIKPYFARYVYIMNVGARDHHWHDVGQSWRSEYELPKGQLIQMMKDLWVDLKPTYEKLHGYIRHKLRQIYSETNVDRYGPFPSHLLDMWGFDWGYLAYKVIPFPGASDLQISAAMLKNKMTVIDMAKTAEKFYVSMGLEKMNDNFWKNSLFSRDPKKNVDCTVTAWDFAPGDYRIKMPCASVNENELLTVIHEMGHIQYDIMYAKQPYSFRNGANPAFHEAVGDALTLSARTPSFLKAVGLLRDGFVSDRRTEINTLMIQALKNIALLPFALTIDFWRWGAFSGEFKPEDYNKAWWALKREYQGVVPPVERTEKDFDPGANSHICNSTPYARYFIGGVLQFQFHEAMCRAAGHKGELHKCSVYGSKKAGAKLRAMLELGKSQPWPIALEKLTGQKKIDAGPIKSYFKPLMEWLDAQQKAYDYPVGW